MRRILCRLIRKMLSSEQMRVCTNVRQIKFTTLFQQPVILAITCDGEEKFCIDIDFSLFVFVAVVVYHSRTEKQHINGEKLNTIYKGCIFAWVCVCGKLADVFTHTRTILSKTYFLATPFTNVI